MTPLEVQSEASESRRQTALIVEGGAMRGAWAAGVLAFLHERGEHQYNLVYAASSGACSAAYFVAGMWEPGLTIWREYACKVVRKTNFLLSGSPSEVAHAFLHRADRLRYRRAHLFPRA